MPAAPTRVAAISGGLGDIGQACALELARNGAHIAIGDLIQDDRVDALRGKLEELDRNFHFAQVDVTDEGSVEEWFNTIEHELGIADVVVVNAAIVECCALPALTSEIWRKHLDVNLTGAMHVAGTAAKRMAAAKRNGHIVLLGSWAAEAAHPHIPAYCVAKAGVRMLCRLLAMQYAEDGIQVNEVAPGLVNAGLSRKLFEQHPQLRVQMVGRVPLQRLMTADEVAWHVARVCDPENQCMTGATITCDGGISLVTAAKGN